MRSADAVIVAPGTAIGTAVAVIDDGGLGVALVCAGDRRLLGIVTDVDLRKGLLRGARLEDRVEAIMCERPTVVTALTPRGDILRIMHTTGVRQVPVVDVDGRVIGVEILRDLTTPAARQTEVVVMAGGRGRRLRPLTDVVPKPMLPIGGRPLLEILLQRLRAQGFVHVTLAINYKGNVIEAYFGAGEALGVRIRYVREREALGTAGALTLLDPPPDRPFLTINGDLLTDVNLEHLVDYHDAQAADITMCVTEYQVHVPFGVVDLDGERVLDVREKPGTTYRVNAGIYVVNPAVLDGVERGQRLEMTDLVRRVITASGRVACFPIRERWVDIGSESDYQRAAASFEASDG